MNKAEFVRERLGVTNADMARLIGVSPSLMSMYDGGFRALPTAALLKYGAIELKLTDAEREIEAEKSAGKPIVKRLAEERSRLFSKLAAQVRKMNLQRHRKNERLKKLKAKFEKSVLLAKVLSALREPLPTAGVAFDQQWLDLLREHAKINFSVKVELEMEMLAVQLEGLSTEIARLEARLAEMNR
jgi:transcriptional regulator with XRE-family HTH domain